ncbi:MAG: T9SS type A sorting domain-containing protein [Candidatus Latescibacteria bacterium]|nr:T9SS type A sorting domain-containing protein [Candidatus Latescibacterota bacterium]
MEYVTNTPEFTSAALHYNNQTGNHRFRYDHFPSIDGSKFYNDYHLFVLEWEENEVRYYVNDILFFKVNKNEDFEADEVWRFNKLHHLLLNVAVGGNLGGTVQGGAWTDYMRVQYVRVYDGPKPTISGNRLVNYSATGEVYTVHNAGGASITWTVPTGATIVSGQGTNAVTVNFGSTSGNVTATFNVGNGNQSLPIFVHVQPNFEVDFILESFEQGIGTGLADYVKSDGVLTAVANLAPNAVNSSSQSGRYVRASGVRYDCIFYTTNAITDAQDYSSGLAFKKFYIDVYTSQAPIGTQIILQLENPAVATPSNYPAGRHSRYVATITQQGVWQRLPFEFLDRPDPNANPYLQSTIVLLFNSNTLTGHTYFYDNLNSYIDANYEPTCISPNYAMNFAGLSSLPAGFTQTGTPTWAVGTSTNALAAGQAPYAYANYSGTAAQAGQMVSDCFDFRSYTDISISMFHRFYTANTGNSAFLEYSINGGTWTQIATWTTSMGAGAAYSSGIIPALAGKHNVKFRWRVVYPVHTGGARQKNWSVDDIAVTGTLAGATLGDVNNDGHINVLDVVWMVRHLTGDTPAGFNLVAADITGGGITVADLTALIDLILGGASKNDVNSEVGEIYLDSDGKVLFNSDGTLTAMQFAFTSANPEMEVKLMLDTDHMVSFNSSTGRGVIYSMNNNQIPAGEHLLMQIEKANLNLLNWGAVKAANVSHKDVDIIAAKFSATSVAGLNNGFGVSVYPNPNSGKFTARINLTAEYKVEIQLIDLIGRVVSQSPRTLLTQGEHQVDFNAAQLINGGVYILRVNLYDANAERLVNRHEEKMLIFK